MWVIDVCLSVRMMSNFSQIATPTVFLRFSRNLAHVIHVPIGKNSGTDLWNFNVKILNQQWSYLGWEAFSGHHCSSACGRMTNGTRNVRRYFSSVTRRSVRWSRRSLPSCRCDCFCKVLWLHHKSALRPRRLWHMSSCLRCADLIFSSSYLSCT